MKHRASRRLRAPCTMMAKACSSFLFLFFWCFGAYTFLCALFF